MFLSPRHALPRHGVLSKRHHHRVFSKKFPFRRRFASRVILLIFKRVINRKFPRHKFSAIKTCFNFNADTHAQPAPTPPGGQSRPGGQSTSTPPAVSDSHPSPPSGPPLTLLLAVKLNPSLPTVILYSPIGGQTHSSPPRGHHPPLMAVNLPPPPGYWCFKGRGVKRGGETGEERRETRDVRQEM